jgi:hypothetical protein
MRKSLHHFIEAPMYSLPAAFVIVRSSDGDWLFLPIYLVAVVAMIVGRYGRFVRQWLDGRRGQDWGTIQAVVDVVSVVPQTEQTRYGERTIGYLATLTYFYRNPELQVGEYCKMFDDEPGARAWADSLKGCSVMVHVDPRDPTHSVLREEELGATVQATSPSPIR